MASTLVWLLRFLHILSGVAWVGGAFFWIMVAAPRLLQRGPPPIRRPVLEAMIKALPRFFYSSGGATIVFGILLLGQIAGWDKFFTILQTAGYGYALGVALLLALIMLATGIFVITPTAHRMLETMQAIPAGAPPSPETQAKLAGLGKRMGIAGMATILLGTIIIGLMTYAVNTPL